MFQCLESVYMSKGFIAAILWWLKPTLHGVPQNFFSRAAPILCERFQLAIVDPSAICLNQIYPPYGQCKQYKWCIVSQICLITMWRAKLRFCPILSYCLNTDLESIWRHTMLSSCTVLAAQNNEFQSHLNWWAIFIIAALLIFGKYS